MVEHLVLHGRFRRNVEALHDDDVWRQPHSVRFTMLHHDPLTLVPAYVHELRLLAHAIFKLHPPLRVFRQRIDRSGGLHLKRSVTAGETRH